MSGDIRCGIGPTGRSRCAGDVGVIGILIPEAVAPLILHGAPIRNRPLAARSTTGGHDGVVPVESRAIDRAVRAVKAADRYLRIPGVLLVTQAVAVIAAE